MVAPYKHKAVYVIEPDAAIRDGLRAFLNTQDVPVFCYSDASVFLDFFCNQYSVDGCLLMEADLPGISSFGLLRLLRNQGVVIPAIVMVSTSSRRIAEQLLSAGAAEVINKPLLNGKLLKSILRLLEQ